MPGHAGFDELTAGHAVHAPWRPRTSGVSFATPGSARTASSRSPASRRWWRRWPGPCRPLPVGSFDIRADAHTPIRLGSLAVPYSGTWTFAVSLEHDRIIPATP